MKKIIAYFFNSALLRRLARVINSKPISIVTIRKPTMQIITIHSGLWPMMEIKFELPFMLAGINGVAEGSFRYAGT